MAKLTYPGPHEGVRILATGQTVRRGETVEIADPDVAVSLIAQGWKPAPTPKPKATKKAAPKKENV